MFGALDISTSGMIAQRTRFEAIATNLANVSTIVDEKGNNTPFQRRVVYFSAGDPAAKTAAGQAMGVHVNAIQSEAGFQLHYEPGNPLADTNGYVKYPNINPVIEQMNAYEAERAYEANVTAAEASKTMLAQSLRLLA